MLGIVLLWVAVAIAGLLIVLGLVITLAGWRHNKHHQVSRTIKLKQSQEAIWAVVNDHANEPTWQTQLEYSKPLPDEQGLPVWEIRHRGLGNPPMKLTTIESNQPTKLVRRIDDAKQVFNGRWVYELTPVSGATMLTITEHSEIKHPFFRGMFHLFGGPALFVNHYLKDLAMKFGEPGEIQDVPEQEGP